MDNPSLGGQPLSGDDGRAVSQPLGAWTIVHTPVDALPDLDVQGYQNQLSGAGAAIVENQVTADHHHAVGAGRQNGTRLLAVWRLLCVRHF
jgi:hypothetical protein